MHVEIICENEVSLIYRGCEKKIHHGEKNKENKTINRLF